MLNSFSKLIVSSFLDIHLSWFLVSRIIQTFVYRSIWFTLKNDQIQPNIPIKTPTPTFAFLSFLIPLFPPIFFRYFIIQTKINEIRCCWSKEKVCSLFSKYSLENWRQWIKLYDIFPVLSYMLSNVVFEQNSCYYLFSHFSSINELWILNEYTDETIFALLFTQFD